MIRSRNVVAASLSIVAGVLFIISGTHGPVGTYELILQKLPTLINDELILSIATTIALVFITISLLGGFVLFAGAYLIYKDHSRTGKLVIGLGTGAGIPWLILILATLIYTENAATVLAQYSTLGWIGIIMALAARFIAK